MIVCSRKCPNCKFVASAMTLQHVWMALYEHYEAMHPKDPA